MKEVEQSILNKIESYQRQEEAIQKRIAEASSRIEKLVKIDDFELSINYLKAIHKVIFNGLLEKSGEFRTENLTKQEKILNGRSVIYPDYKNIEKCLNYDIKKERKTKYQNLTEEEKVKNIAKFASNIWQAHPFREGNTRTTSVFIEKYLIYLGYKVDNHIFKENSRYFRNALVKSAYYNSLLSIKPDYEPLYNFFRKVMIDDSIELDEESLYVDILFTKEQIEKRKTLTKKK